MFWIFLIAFIALVIIIFLDYYRKDINDIQEGEKTLIGLHNGLKKKGFYWKALFIISLILLIGAIIGFKIINEKYKIDYFKIISILLVALMVLSELTFTLKAGLNSLKLLIKKKRKKYRNTTFYWRVKYEGITHFIERFIPFLYYFAITLYVDYRLDLFSDSDETISKNSILIFEICLFYGGLWISTPKTKKKKINFPVGMLFLPFINIIYLFLNTETINSGWFIAVNFILGFVVLLIGTDSGEKSGNGYLSEDDLEYFRKEIYPKLPPVSEWPVQGYLHYEYPGWAKLFPELPERFHHYTLVQEDEDHWASINGLFLNGKKVW